MEVRETLISMSLFIANVLTELQAISGTRPREGKADFFLHSSLLPGELILSLLGDGPHQLFSPVWPVFGLEIYALGWSC